MAGLIWWWIISLCLHSVLSTVEKKMSNTVVTINEGKLRGLIGKNYDGESFYKFFGIPYAKPPVGELRFQLPQPTDSWTGIRDATKVGDSCMSRDDLSSNIIGSEDCLYLNVYTRNLPNHNSTLKPVMVYIHGGGLVLGSSRPEIVGPEFLMLKDVVLVTFNYRLGVLGFLSFDDPALGVPGNLGLKDQVLLLKWVQRNIRSFNGDPDNVMIFGNSAGGASVHAHVLSQKSKGLFHKAIAQSGCTLNPWFWGSKNNAQELVRHAGRNANTGREALDILKMLPVSELFAAQEKMDDSPYPAARRPFSAVIEYPHETAFISKNPVQLIEENRYNHVPMVLGYMQNEGMLLDLDQMVAIERGQKVRPYELKNMIPFNMNVTNDTPDGKIILSRLEKLYSNKPPSDRYDPMTDGYFLVGITEAIKLHLKTAVHPIYLYRMSLHGELNHLKRLMNRTSEPGACHADELGYLFHTNVTVPITPDSLEDRSLRAFVDMWTSFAIHGNPTPEHNNVKWMPIENEYQLRVMNIDSELEMREFPERDRLNVWWDILKQWPLVKFS